MGPPSPSELTQSAPLINRLGKSIDFKSSEQAIRELVQAKQNLGERFPRIAIFIVSYHASEKLAQTVARIPGSLLPILEEIYIFDDASKDNTFQVAKDLTTNSTSGSKIRAYSNPRNLGYGGNQKVGYRYAIEKKFDYVVLLHGDGQYAPEHLPEMILPVLKSDISAVFGSRMIQKKDALQGGMPVYKWIGNQLLTGFENFILGLNLSEYHTGYRLYSVETLKRIPFESNTDDFHFDSQIIVQLRALGANIEEVPIKTFYGDEACHVNGLKYAKDVCLSVLEYRFHQLHLIRRNRYMMDADKIYTRKVSPYSSHEKIIAMLKKPGLALDVGSYKGLLTEDLKKKGIASIGIDLVDPKEASREFKHYVQTDLEKTDSLQFPRQFDYVVMADVIEHIRNAPQLLKRVRAFLKHDGSLIVSTPNIAIWFYRISLLIGRFNYGSKGVLDDTHVKLYTVDSIKKTVEQAGFKIVRAEYTGLPFEVVFESIGKSKFLRGIDWCYHTLVRFWPRMFAYQIILEGKIAQYEAKEGEGRIV